MSELAFRTAEVSDAARLTEIAIASKSYWGYSPELLASWRKELGFTEESIVSRLVLVAEVKAAIIGVSALKPTGGYVEIEDFWLRPDVIGNGYGRELMSYTVSRAREEGYTILRVASDPNAVGFYQHMGAVQIGWRDSTPAGRKLPVMEFALDP